MKMHSYRNANIYLITIHMRLNQSFLDKINFLIDNQDGSMNKSIVDGDSERITKYENIHRKRLQCNRTIDVEGNEQ